MKKHLLLFSSLLLISLSTIGQTLIWEAFDAAQMPPTGWTLNGYTAQWSTGGSSNAGGVAPEAIFTYIQATGISRFISPSLNTTGLTSLKLNFKHMYDDYTGAGPKVGVATRSNQATTWNTVWEINPTANVGPETIDVTINNSDVGSADFQICFYVNGNMYNVDYWYLDNILLFNPLTLNGGLIALTNPTYFGDPVPVTGTIMNVGTTAITNFEVNWTLDNGPVYSTTFSSLNIPMLGTYDFTTTDQIVTVIGSHNLTVWINKVNGVTDLDQSNDTAMANVNKVSHVIDKKPIYEEFTSSTCAPCAQFNQGFVPWCITNEDNITLVKYQMNWPGTGDPYYTEEGGVRREYYGVGYVPDLYVNGAQVATDMTAVQNAYNQGILEPGLCKVAAKHTLTGTTINVDATVLPFADFSNVRIHIIVFENTTTGNVASNGETEFHHVMMKMIPDANGTTANLTDRVPFNITQSVNLAGTNIEEYDDLGVSILIQGYANKKIYQSGYFVENGVFNTEARLQMINVDGTPIPDFNPDTFDYTVHLPSSATEVPELTGIPIDVNETVIVVPTVDLPGSTTIDVFAENLVNHNLYTVDFVVGGVGTGDNIVQPVNLYPNPTRGLVHILNAYGAQINVYNASGTLVKTVEQFNSNTLDLSNLNQGVYFLSVEKPGKQVIRKKIVIL